MFMFLMKNSTIKYRKNLLSKNLPHNVIHNVYTTSTQRRTTFKTFFFKRNVCTTYLHNVIHNVRTTSTQRLHNVCTTFPGPCMADCFGKSTVLMVRAVCPSPVIARRALHNVRTTSPKSHTQRLHNVTHNVRTTSTQRPHNVPGADYE